MPINEKGNGIKNVNNKLIPIDNPTHITIFKIKSLVLLIVINA
jgi:hypothetical protein